MTNEQLYISIGIPMAFNAVLVGLLIAYINAKIDGCNLRIDSLRNEMHAGFAAVNQRFDDMRDLWRAELG